MLDLIQVAAQPFAPLIGFAPLMRRAMRNDSLEPIAAALLKRAREHPTDAHALLDASIVLQLTGQAAAAMLMQERALRLQTLYSLPARQPGLTLLAIMSPGELMWNTPLELLLEDGDVSLDLLYLEPGQEWPETVPSHDVMFVAMAECEANQPLLRRLAGAAAQWPRPVVNPPLRIAALSRDGASMLLRDIAGTLMPPTVRVERATLGQRRDFPLIVRPIDSHAGQDLALLRQDSDVAEYLERIDASCFYLSPFIDYRSADGCYRKYRVALIDGRPYISHLAISSHWVVHYLNAGMDQSADKRAEEAASMAQFDQQFAVRHAAALHTIYERAGLDYLTVDCAETAGGELLIFEVGTAMLVHALDDETRYPYKQPAMRTLFAAFRRMLETARTRAPG